LKREHEIEVEKKLYKTKRGILLSAIAIVAILFTATIGVPTYAQSEEAGNVHGTVVDEDGIAFHRVKVMAHSSSGSLAATKYTDRDGFFRFALASGSYTISFEKEGYAKVEISIMVPTGYVVEPENDPVKMGEIVLKRALRIQASVLTRVVNPGDTMLFPFTISNIGEEPEEVEFYIDNPAGWTTRILDQTGEIKRVLLMSGSLSFNLEVTIPSTAIGNTTVSLTASGKTSSTLDFTLLTHATRDIELTSTFPFVSAELGRTIYYPLSIKNMGETDETVDLIGVVPNGWTIHFITTTQMEVLSLFLTSGQSESLTVEVVQPEEVTVGEYTLVINAVSQDGGLRDSLDLRVNLREATSDVEVISTFTDVTVEAGKAIQYPITIWNKGDRDVLFLLTVLSAPDNWKTVFIAEDIEISSFLITAGESMSLKLKVTPPSVVETGDYQIVIRAESDDGVISKQIELKASVVGYYELNMELSSLYKTITTGASTTFTAKITNTGKSPVTTLYLEADAPEEWDVSIIPVQVASLAPKESLTFNIMAETPADTVAGDYMITLKALSDQVESEEAQLRVAAQASTSWGFIGFGVAGVVIISLIIVFMKFRRR